MPRRYYYGIHHEESWSEEDTRDDHLANAASDCSLLGVTPPPEVQDYIRRQQRQEALSRNPDYLLAQNQTNWARRDERYRLSRRSSDPPPFSPSLSTPTEGDSQTSSDTGRLSRTRLERTRGYGYLTLQGLSRVYGSLEDIPAGLRPHVYVEQDGNTPLTELARVTIREAGQPAFQCHLEGPGGSFPSWTWEPDPEVTRWLNPSKSTE